MHRRNFILALLLAPLATASGEADTEAREIARRMAFLLAQGAALSYQDEMRMATDAILAEHKSEAGEKAANPPLVATKDVVKSDMQQFPRGVTWIDAEYDERLGEALRAMNIDVKGLPINLDLAS